jgi:hypothetical protein
MATPALEVVGLRKTYVRDGRTTEVKQRVALARVLAFDPAVLRWTSRSARSTRRHAKRCRPS